MGTKPRRRVAATIPVSIACVCKDLAIRVYSVWFRTRRRRVAAMPVSIACGRVQELGVRLRVRVVLHVSGLGIDFLHFLHLGARGQGLGGASRPPSPDPPPVFRVLGFWGLGLSVE